MDRREGRRAPLTLDDILVITPYNAQVRDDRRADLPGVRVGTVDKFQGQEAPISIYSMASSSVEDAPRGMEFLYNLHRLNVATSRARCVVARRRESRSWSASAAARRARCGSRTGSRQLLEFAAAARTIRPILRAASKSVTR